MKSTAIRYLALVSSALLLSPALARSACPDFSALYPACAVKFSTGELLEDSWPPPVVEENDLSTAVTWPTPGTYVPDANVDGNAERDEVCNTTDLDGSCNVNATHAGSAHHADESPASETVAGIIEIATLAEVNSGIATNLAVTPYTLENTALAGEISGTLRNNAVDANHAGSPHSDYLPLAGGTMTNDIIFPNNEGVLLGAGSASAIYYDGTNLVVNPRVVGTGYTGFTGAIRVAPTLDVMSVFGGDVDGVAESDANDRVVINKNRTGNTGAQRALLVGLDIENDVTTAANIHTYGSLTYATTNSANTVTMNRILDGGGLVAARAQARHRASGTVKMASAFSGAVELSTNAASVVTDGITFMDEGCNSGSGTLTTCYGLYSRAPEGAADYKYGVYIEGFTGNTNFGNTGIYIGEMDDFGIDTVSGIRIGGDVELTRITTSTLGMNSHIRFSGEYGFTFYDASIGAFSDNDGYLDFYADVGIRMRFPTTPDIRFSSEKVEFGTAFDTNLYRSAADTLATDDSLAVAETITGKVSIVISSSGPVTAAMRGQRYIHEGGSTDITYDLPAAAAGLNGCFQDNSDDTGKIVLSPVAGDTISVGGVDAAAGADVSSDGTTGHYICITAIDDTEWISWDYLGPWS